MPENPRHNHVTRDIKPVGQCPACDRYHARRAAEQVAAVIAEHQVVRVSDGTYACAGCSHRYEESHTRDTFDLTEYRQVTFPGWSFTDYAAHVAEALGEAGLTSAAATPAPAPQDVESAATVQDQVAALHTKTYRTAGDEVWGLNPICGHDAEPYPCETLRHIGLASAEEAGGG